MCTKAASTDGGSKNNAADWGSGVGWALEIYAVGSFVVVVATAITSLLVDFIVRMCEYVCTFFQWDQRKNFTRGQCTIMY